MTSNKHIILHLSLIPQIGPATVQTLVAAVGLENHSCVCSYKVQDFTALGVNLSMASRLIEGLANDAVIDEELRLCALHNISWTTVYEHDYPVLLQHIHLPPSVIYWRGNSFEHYQKRIAVIGSREATSYGETVIKALVPELVEAGWTIVSGGALGADSMAHKAALAAHGKTIAITGAGLLKPYPYSNKFLFENIVNSDGIYMSSFPLTMSALPGNFPARNRIISGMSAGIVVIQAAYESGTRSTALYALEQGREVCAVPGRIDDPLSKGCHRLLSEGATLISSAADILSVLGEQRQKQPHIITTSVQEEHTDPLVQACRQPQTFDELLQYVPSPEALRERLCFLQFEGLIEQDIIGRWRAIPR